VLVGFDDARRIALVADRLDPAAQECSYEALAKSRNPKDFLSTFNMWGRFSDTTPRRSVREATERAVARAARRMTGAKRDDRASFEQLAPATHIEVASGLAAFAKIDGVIASLAERPRAKEIARYASACIESFGTGGGNFRTMYAKFLGRARTLVPDAVGADAAELAAEAARLWTRLSGQLGAFAKSEAETSRRELGNGLDDARAVVASLAEVETRLFESLASATASTQL
jgi:hypothetical protein